ncbi:hypothetical protein CANARDRAFT_9904 [[Candida] arabinofermentans NRRL YB-2248]|uniref:Rad21/Rec8-like protein N-terminal domain-containing protein n=1 Tax=[Candida] arabinofermentans NRRL YB-2248 TaxID=983967 RepID=A0A1E4SUJ1_9ASCO|nr:hypothetical protein CANARDRAFT_9904 [[Candida] arabinofermentans NRRL YB-2248]
MFYSEQLLAKEGPLAYVWLAANLEKKLTKQQFLNTSITESAHAIVSSSSSSSSSGGSNDALTTSQREFHNQYDTEPLALRLTGQLLYGVVRIYSRKAKYLFDDVTDALVKLKSSFRTSQSVILPAESTVITSMKTVILQDTVTEADLLYQEPLNFDELIASQQSRQQHNQQRISAFDEEDSFVDRSIENPRRAPTEIDELEGMDDDLELDLNFDLNDDAADQSIEQGRAVDGNDVNASNIADQVDAFELPDFDEPMLDIDSMHDQSVELDEPHTPRGDTATAVTDINDDAHLNEPVSKKKRTAIVFDNTDVVRTERRKIIVDNITEIPPDIIKANQANYPLRPTENLASQSTSIESILRLSSLNTANSEYLNFNLGNFKRRRFDTNNSSQRNNDENEPEYPQLQQEIDDFELPSLQPEFDEPESYEVGEPNEAVIEDDGKFLPELDDEIENFEENNLTIGSTTISKSTVNIATHLRSKLGDETTGETNSIQFSELMSEDLESENPLSQNPKREATRLFFELLVLATSDTVELKQDRLFGEINISSKSTLFEKFL